MKSELIFSEVLFPVRSEYSNRLPGPSSSPVALLSFIHWRKALTDESSPDGIVANHILYSFSRSSCFNPKAENKDSHSNDTHAGADRVYFESWWWVLYHRKSLKWIKKRFTLKHSRSLEEERVEPGFLPIQAGKSEICAKPMRNSSGVNGRIEKLCCVRLQLLATL